MPTSRKSAAASKPSRREHRALGRRLIAAMDEVAAHLRGEIQLTEYEVRVPEQVDVAALRRRLDLSQAAFARTYGLDVAAVRAWEQHRRKPDRTARILLAVIAREPAAVLRALVFPRD
jgi:putative transcriptional regulator